jgi:hypothetical protein
VPFDEDTKGATVAGADLRHYFSVAFVHPIH